MKTLLTLIILVFSTIGFSQIKITKEGEFKYIEKATYTDTGKKVEIDGVLHPIYLTAKKEGKQQKFFIFQTSKKSGKQYRKYLKVVVDERKVTL